MLAADVSFDIILTLLVWKKEDGVGPIKLVKHHHSVKKFQTPSVSRRNARERNRVKQVNSGFSVLKDHVPHLKNKTSKVFKQKLVY